MINALRIIRWHRAKVARVMTLAFATHTMPAFASSFSIGVAPATFAPSAFIAAVDGRRYRARRSTPCVLDVA